MQTDQTKAADPDIRIKKKCLSYLIYFLLMD